MIDWAAFVSVAVASLVAACLLVALYAVGVRLVTGAGPVPRVRRAAGITCFVMCGALVLFGIYLIVPALHGA